jgi:hypothetical protein
MLIEDFKNDVKEFELKKFQKVLNLCNSPIEELFVGKVYSFFLTKGLSINLITQSVDEFQPTDDNRYKSVYYHTNEIGLKIEIDYANAQCSNDLTGDPERVCGFRFSCGDVYYEYYPQYPIFNSEHIRFADFVIKVKDGNNVSIADFVIECDGFAWHSTRRQLENDNHRSRFITSQGYRILRYTGSEINRIDDLFIINLENTIYHSIFKKESNLYSLLMH